MTLRTPYANDAKQYDFGYLRHLAETLLNSEGVANYATDMVVTPAGTGLRVDIAAGAAWVKGDSGTPAMGISQGLFSVVNDAAVTNAVTLPTADPTNPRLDQIVLKVRDSADLGSGADDALFEYVQGTPTGGATLSNRNGAAALGNDRLLLADVLVPATATNLTAANVRDRRIPANGRATRYIATTENMGTSYADLATPDIIEAYVPAGAHVHLRYEAMVRSSAANVLFAPFVINTATMTAAQAQYVDASGAAGPNNLEYTMTWSSGNYWAPLGLGMVPANGFPVSVDAAEVAAGTPQAQINGTSITAGGVWITNLAAGNYQFTVRAKTASGTGQLKSRKMMVNVVGNGRSQ